MNAGGEATDRYGASSRSRWFRHRSARTPIPALPTRVGSVELRNPVLTASGTAGHGAELASYVDLAGLGAVVTKSVSADPWPGNAAPRVHEATAGMLNAVGLQGRGVAVWLDEELPPLLASGAAVVASIWGRSIDDYRRAADLLADAPAGVVAVEVNLSCPNVEDRSGMFAHSAEATEAAMASTAGCGRPRWAKLSPNAGDLVPIVDAAVRGGAEAVTLVNTVMGMAIDPATRNIDLDRLDAAITPKTRAIVPVDLAGLPVDRDRLYAIANAHRLRVVEDAAQSFGANWRGKAIGASGDFVSFSFHANKNLTTGEGGALVLPADVDPALCERYRLQGVRRSPDGGMDVDVLGGKFNLTDIAAAIGLGQLKHLETFTARRRALAQRYFAQLDSTLGLGLPPADFTQSNWHMFQPLLPRGTDRGAFVNAMREQGIGVGVHYPPLHLFSLYRKLGFQPGQFPNAEDIGARTVTLPLFPAMADSDVDRVCAALAAALPRKST